MESVATSGSLEEQHVAHVLVSLHQQKATGSLRLERAPLQKAVYLKEGQILFAASNDPKDQLASILVEEGKLGPDQMAVAQARVSAGNPLAKVLTELGYVSQRELADAARLKVEKILVDLYSWREGTFQFADGSLPKGAIDLELSTPKLLFNSMRRIQEREWVLNQFKSLDTVLGATASFQSFLAGAEPEPRAAEVLRLVDGVKSIKQIAAVSTLGEFEVCKILVAAFLLGALEARQVLREPQPAVSAARSEPRDLETLFETVSPQPQRGGKAFGTTPPSGNKKAADFMIEEEPAPARPMAVRTSARPRQSKAQATGGSSRSIVKLVLGVVLLAALAGGAYFFFFMRRGAAKPPSQPSTQARATTTVPAAGPTPAQPLPPPPTSSAPPGGAETAAAAPAPGGSRPPVASPSPTTVPPAAASGGPGATPAQPPSPGPPAIKPPALPTSSIPAPQPPVTGARPRPAPPPTTGPASGGLAAGQSLLKSGSYDQAAAAFLQQINATGKGKYTIAISINCDAGNVGAAVQNASGSSELFILPARFNNRSCYRVCWGLFDSAEAAARAIGTIPEYFQKQKPVSVATARLLR